MSGGTFDYVQYRFAEIADTIQSRIDSNGKPVNEDGWGQETYSPETIKEFQTGIEHIRKAQVYANRIDWLMAGDDGEATFHHRLKEDLAAIKLRGK